MTVNEWTKVMALAVTAAAAVLSGLYAMTDQRRATKRTLRAYEAAVFIWLMSIYIAAVMGNKDPVFLSGVYTRTGVIALTFLFIGEIITDWKRKG